MDTQDKEDEIKQETDKKQEEMKTADATDNETSYQTEPKNTE